MLNPLNSRKLYLLNEDHPEIVYRKKGKKYDAHIREQTQTRARVVFHREILTTDVFQVHVPDQGRQHKGDKSSQGHQGSHIGTKG